MLFKHYQYGRTDHDRLTSQSMAKTVTAMLIGIAVSEHAIRSIDDPAAAYVPELAGTALGGTPIRALLHMASGIAFTESYNGADDSAALGRDLFARAGPGPVAAVSRFNTRDAPPDTVWHYAGLDTEVLGLVLARATGLSLAQYLKPASGSRWAPRPMQAGPWIALGRKSRIAASTRCCGITPGSGCCWQAAGQWPASRSSRGSGCWTRRPRQARTPSWHPAVWVPAGAALGAMGTQVWLLPGARSFVLAGVHGQRVYVDPASGFVLVQTTVRVAPTRNLGDAELTALWRALLAQEAPG